LVLGGLLFFIDVLCGSVLLTKLVRNFLSFVGRRLRARRVQDARHEACEKGKKGQVERSISGAASLESESTGFCSFVQGEKTVTSRAAQLHRYTK